MVNTISLSPTCEQSGRLLLSPINTLLIALFTLKHVSMLLCDSFLTPNDAMFQSPFGNNAFIGDEYIPISPLLVSTPSNSADLQNRVTDYSQYACTFKMEDDFAYSQGNREFTNLDTVAENIDHTGGWISKRIEEWHPRDVQNWLIDTATERHLLSQSIPYSKFSSVTGIDLMNMSHEQFAMCFGCAASEIGFHATIDELYRDLQIKCNRGYAVLKSEEAVVPVPVMDRAYNCDAELQFFEMDNSNLRQISDMFEWGISEGSRTDEDSKSNLPNSGYCQPLPVDNISREVQITKRPPGRPKGSGKKLEKKDKNVRIPEFIRDLLFNPEYCPRIIRWENYETGLFKFVRGDEVAKLWGGKRNNKKMSFDKFSRAMRYHYKQEALVSVPSARLVYQFGRKGPNYKISKPIGIDERHKS